MICLSDSPVQKIYTKHFDPCLQVIKSLTGHKEKISIENFMKNLNKNAILIENFLSDWISGVDQTTLSFSNKGELKISHVDDRIAK